MKNISWYQKNYSIKKEQIRIYEPSSKAPPPEGFGEAKLLSSSSCQQDSHLHALTKQELSM